MWGRNTGTPAGPGLCPVKPYAVGGGNRPWGRGGGENGEAWPRAAERACIPAVRDHLEHPSPFAEEGSELISQKPTGSKPWAQG